MAIIPFSLCSDVLNYQFLIQHSFLQPSFIVAILAPGENNENHSSIGDAKLQRNETSVVPLVSRGSSLVDALISYIECADDLIKRYNKEGFGVGEEEGGCSSVFLLRFLSLLLILFVISLLFIHFFLISLHTVFFFLSPVSRAYFFVCLTS